MDSLPLEIQIEILFATPRDLFQLVAMVCRDWNALTKQFPKPYVKNAVLFHFVRERDRRLPEKEGRCC